MDQLVQCLTFLESPVNRLADPFAEPKQPRNQHLVALKNQKVLRPVHLVEHPTHSHWDHWDHLGSPSPLPKRVQ